MAYLPARIRWSGTSQLSGVGFDRFYQPGSLAGDVSPNIPTLPLKTAASGAVNATLAVTLDNFTLSASADVIISASFAQTIADVTLSSAADVIISATYGQTLDNFTLAATSTLTSGINATFGVTIGDFTLSANATLPISGTFSQTIAAFTQSASADVIIAATFGQTIAAFTQAATATLPISAQFNQTVENFTLAATSTLAGGAISATLGITIAAFILDVTASLESVLAQQEPFDTHDGKPRKTQDEIHAELYRARHKAIRDTISRLMRGDEAGPQEADKVETALEDPLPRSLTRILEQDYSGQIAELLEEYRTLELAIQRAEDDEIMALMAMGAI